AEFSGAAVRELQLYDDENPPIVTRPPRKVPLHDPVPGIYGYLIVICLVAWLDTNGAFGESWRTAGRVDGELMRAGEWWRVFTALTLHADLPHLAGNIVFGSLFGLFAGRLIGSGVGWLVILLAAGAGNLLNTYLLGFDHRAIGASTAVFAALGLVAGFVWRAKLMSQERWVYRLGPIVGGLALLMFTGAGSGDGKTDVGAHLMGFVCGFAAGVPLTVAIPNLMSKRLQLACGIGALFFVALTWVLALGPRQSAAIM
ncbi:MAG: rhomboid family intramembrane serine protease, partial [Woeseiaceae bacterium]